MNGGYIFYCTAKNVLITGDELTCDVTVDTIMNDNNETYTLNNNNFIKKDYSKSLNLEFKLNIKKNWFEDDIISFTPKSNNKNYEIIGIYQ